jgi:hypothetical protein
MQFKRWNSVVGIETRLQAGRSRVPILAEARNFSMIQNIQTDAAVHPALYSFPGLKQLGCE